MSFRTFIRSVKNVKDDQALFTAVKTYDPSVKVKTSGVRALQELVCKKILDLNNKTTIETFKILNTLVYQRSVHVVTAQLKIVMSRFVNASRLAGAKTQTLLKRHIPL